MDEQPTITQLCDGSWDFHWAKAGRLINFQPITGKATFASKDGPPGVIHGAKHPNESCDDGCEFKKGESVGRSI